MLLGNFRGAIFWYTFGCAEGSGNRQVLIEQPPPRLGAIFGGAGSCLLSNNYGRRKRILIFFAGPHFQCNILPVHARIQIGFCNPSTRAPRYMVYRAFSGITC